MVAWSCPRCCACVCTCVCTCVTPVLKFHCVGVGVHGVSWFAPITSPSHHFALHRVPCIVCPAHCTLWSVQPRGHRLLLPPRRCEEQEESVSGTSVAQLPSVSARSLCAMRCVRCSAAVRRGDYNAVRCGALLLRSTCLRSFLGVPLVACWARSSSLRRTNSTFPTSGRCGC